MLHAQWCGVADSNTIANHSATSPMPLHACADSMHISHPRHVTNDISVTLKSYDACRALSFLLAVRAVSCHTTARHRVLLSSAEG
jgi:hypothetical protein